MDEWTLDRAAEFAEFSALVALRVCGLAKICKTVTSKLLPIFGGLGLTCIEVDFCFRWCCNVSKESYRTIFFLKAALLLLSFFFMSSSQVVAKPARNAARSIEQVVASSSDSGIT